MRTWAWVGLALLVGVNVFLVVLLLNPDVAVWPLGDAASASESADGADLAASGEATPADATPAEEPAAPVSRAAPTERVLTVASERLAWRAVVGTCGAPGLLEHSSDGGVTWTAQDVGLAPIARLKATSATSVFAIGGGEDCAPTFRLSTTAGTAWTTTDTELPGSWYLEPAARDALQAQVHGPRGDLVAPCPTGVVDLAALDDARAGLLCVDGSFQTTDDGGASWSQEGAAPDAVAIAPAGGAYVVAAVREPCAGLAVLTVANDGTGLDAAPTACAPVDVAAPGQVAVAAVGSAVWVWAGDLVVVSRDGGVTW